MNYENLKIKINDLFVEAAIEIWLYEEHHDKTTVIWQKDGQLMGTTIPHGEVAPEEAEPFLKLPVRFAEAFFKLLLEDNARQGKKSPTENHLEGKLEATQIHLHDMRTLATKAINKLIQKI